jgi:hypothetical protein
MAQPRDSDPITGFEAAAPFTEVRNFADHLMSGDDPFVFRRQIAFSHMQVGAANPAHVHAHQDFAGFGPRPFHLNRLQRIGFDGRRPVHRHRMHDFGPNCHVSMLS